MKTNQQLVTFAAIAAILGGLIGYLVHTTQNGDSPVRVVGGSIHLLEDRGWTQTTPGPPSNCVSGPVDICNYTSQLIDTTKLLIENVKDSAGHDHPVDNPKRINVTGRWTIDVYASKDDGTQDTNGVSLCTSASTGSCDSGTRSDYVTIQHRGSYGFYPNDPAKQKRYHNGNLANCPNGHCEDMNRIEVTINGGPADVYTCNSSVECKIKIGQ
jgi:hypothetical protein